MNNFEPYNPVPKPSRHMKRPCVLTVTGYAVLMIAAFLVAFIGYLVVNI